MMAHTLKQIADGLPEKSSPRIGVINKGRNLLLIPKNNPMTTNGLDVLMMGGSIGLSVSLFMAGAILGAAFFVVCAGVILLCALADN